MKEEIDLITTALYNDYEVEEVDMIEESMLVVVNKKRFLIYIDTEIDWVYADASPDPEEYPVDVVSKVNSVHFINDSDDLIKLDLTAEEREHVREQVQQYELND